MFTLRDLHKLTGTVEKAVKFCRRYNLLPKEENFDCVECKGIKSVKWVKNKQNKNVPYYLMCKLCKKKCNATKNTWFHGTKLSLTDSLEIIYGFLLSLPQSHVAVQARVTEKTVSQHFSMLREICSVILQEGNEMIGGPNHIVEIDEFHLYTRKYNSGQLLTKRQRVWIFGGIDRETKECFMVRILKRNRETLMPIIKKFIRPNTLIISDSWRAYNSLEQEGYVHEAVNHQIEFVRSDDPRVHIQTVKRLWRSVKESRSTSGRKSDIIDNQRLAEFLYFKRKGMKTAADIFINFLVDIAKVYPGYGKKGLRNEEDNDEMEEDEEEMIEVEEHD